MKFLQFMCKKLPKSYIPDLENIQKREYSLFMASYDHHSAKKWELSFNAFLETCCYTCWDSFVLAYYVSYFCFVL